MLRCRCSCGWAGMYRLGTAGDGPAASQLVSLCLCLPQVKSYAEEQEELELRVGLVGGRELHASSPREGAAVHEPLRARSAHMS